MESTAAPVGVDVLIVAAPVVVGVLIVAATLIVDVLILAAFLVVDILIFGSGMISGYLSVMLISYDCSRQQPSLLASLQLQCLNCLK